MGNVFLVPPAICYGPGAIQRIGKVIRDAGVERVLVVTDEGVQRAGIVSVATKVLDEEGVSWEAFSGVQPDPVVENVVQGLERFRQGRFEALLAIGGGSSIDCSKAISIALANGLNIKTFMGMEKVPRGGPPVFAVPTTAGTGSEVTRVLVITDPRSSEKMMIASRFAVCRAAIVDPEVTLGLPAHITAATGVDALAHAIEAYVSRLSQPLTDVLALSAVRRIARHLRRAYRIGDDLEARSQVMMGATEAGMAFSNASVALIHGMARPIGAFFHLPHGVCIAMLTPLVTRHSWQADETRYAQVMRALGEGCEGESDASLAARLADALQRLVDDVGIRPLREQPGVNEKAWMSVVDVMARQALGSGSPDNHPWPVDLRGIAGLYRRLFTGEGVSGR